MGEGQKVINSCQSRKRKWHPTMSGCIHSANFVFTDLLLQIVFRYMWRLW